MIRIHISALVEACVRPSVMRPKRPKGVEVRDVEYDRLLSSAMRPPRMAYSQSSRVPHPMRGTRDKVTVRYNRSEDGGRAGLRRWVDRARTTSDRGRSARPAAQSALHRAQCSWEDGGRAGLRRSMDRTRTTLDRGRSARPATQSTLQRFRVSRSRARSQPQGFGPVIGASSFRGQTNNDSNPRLR